MNSFINALQFARPARLLAQASFVAILAVAGVSIGAIHPAIACEEHDKAAETQAAQKIEGAIFVQGDLSIEQPWSRATAKGARVAGGYMELVNKGEVDDVFVSGSTDIAERFEVHEMAMNDGIMTMRKLEDGLVIKAGDKVTLKPGSYHAMFMGLKRPLVEGETFTADLVFKNAGTVPVTFTVRGLGARKNEKGGHAAHDAN